MATFYEVKQLLCRLFGHRDIEDNDDDITVELRSYRGECENRQIQVDISHILGNLITVIFNYQILRKPLKILSL